VKLRFRTEDDERVRAHRKSLTFQRDKACRWRESNPHSSCPERDFESRASASSATPARPVNYKGKRRHFQETGPLRLPGSVCYSFGMPTPERIEKVDRVLSHRQSDLRVVLEGVTIAHNASAVIRTCDAAGVLYLDLVSPNPELIRFNEAISTRADKWLEIAVHPTPAECLAPLKKAGFEIVATHLQKDSAPYTDVDFARPVALVFGSESEGISEEALAFADKVVRIPMLGMVQSLNLSVSVAVILYEALRQRSAKGYFEKARLSAEEFERLRKRWLNIPPE
jgi:tRNA (guanosine-2'-O-)-methyltransferase